MPASTTVVWSVGHLNFPSSHEGLEINREVYPIGLVNAARLRWWGLPFAKLRGNLLFFNPATQVMSRGPLARRMIDEALAVEVWRSPEPRAEPAPAPAPAPSSSPTPAPSPASRVDPPERGTPGPSVAPVISRAAPSEAEVQRRLEQLAQDPSFARTEVRRVDGLATSIESFRAGGGYWREELDPAFFRGKQQAARAHLPEGEAPSPAEVRVSPPYWRAFLAILDLCQARGVRLIVNELEEAPHQYPTRAHQLAYREFMRQRVEPEVTRRGFVYLRTDLDQLEDRHYFDYNHLNSRGVLAYARLLAPRLRQHLPPRD